MKIFCIIRHEDPIPNTLYYLECPLSCEVSFDTAIAELENSRQMVVQTLRDQCPLFCIAGVVFNESRLSFFSNSLKCYYVIERAKSK